MLKPDDAASAEEGLAMDEDTLTTDDDVLLM
jgi:hypothetical protein